MQNVIFFLLFIAGVVYALSLLWFSFKLINVYIGPKERRFENRLANLTSEIHGSKLIKNDLTDRAINSFGMIANIQDAKPMKWLEFQISKSGASITAENFILVSLILFLCSLFLTYYIFTSYSLAFLSGFIAAIFPYLVLRIWIRRRQALLETQLPDLLDFMARSLQVGHSFNTTLQMAASEAPTPLSVEIKRVFDELNFGVPLQKVLSELSSRIDCSEIRYFVIAVIVNREIGGNLAEILNKVSQLIRGRMEFHQSIRVLSSEGKASALILGGLPFLVGGLIFFITPESFNLMLNDSLGRDLFFYAGVLMAFGYSWMNQICKVKV